MTVIWKNKTFFFLNWRWQLKWSTVRTFLCFVKKHMARRFFSFCCILITTERENRMKYKKKSILTYEYMNLQRISFYGKSPYNNKKKSIKRVINYSQQFTCLHFAYIVSVCFEICRLSIIELYLYYNWMQFLWIQNDNGRWSVYIIYLFTAQLNTKHI